mmetsp:Transcript_6458/g.12598  ORF Transcript_6458/g.12598 Transcript_6458/m.12598 type:complete len:84 (+) Transcript_6458:52-303(+)
MPCRCQRPGLHTLLVSIQVAQFTFHGDQEAGAFSRPSQPGLAEETGAFPFGVLAKKWTAAISFNTSQTMLLTCFPCPRSQIQT